MGLLGGGAGRGSVVLQVGVDFCCWGGVAAWQSGDAAGWNRRIAPPRRFDIKRHDHAGSYRIIGLLGGGAGWVALCCRLEWKGRSVQTIRYQAA